MASSLPFIISNPHCGESIPPEIVRQSQLSLLDITQDSDQQALEIYSPLADVCDYYLEADIARAFVDLNRSADDFSKDGVVKTHTCYDIPVYEDTLSTRQKHRLLANYYSPYHEQLEQAANSGDFQFLFDCHTMAATPPPVTNAPEGKRPLVCLSNNIDKSCPASLFDQVVEIFSDVFDGDVGVNNPFKGGFICQNYGRLMPTIQIEVSETERMSAAAKSALIVEAMNEIAVNI